MLSRSPSYLGVIVVGLWDGTSKTRSRVAGTLTTMALNVMKKCKLVSQLATGFEKHVLINNYQITYITYILIF